MKALLAVVLLFPALVLAQVPQKIGYQGRLLKADGTPEAGSAQMTFALFATPTAGSALWTELQTVGLTDGYYALFLGDVTALPNGVFDGTERWLEVSVGGTPLTPRQRVGSVPYALSCTNARNLAGGTINASSISVNGQSVTDASGKVDWTQLKSCPTAGDVLSWTATGWACQPGIGAVSVSAPLAGAGTPASPLALPAASATSNGYLSSADWTAFDAKVAGTDARLSDDRDPLPGSANYIQAQNTAAQSASFRISGPASVIGNLGAGTATPAARFEVVGAPATGGTGLITGFSGSATLSGAGTRFQSEVNSGDVVVTSGGQTFIALAAPDDVTLTVTPASTVNFANQTFTVQKSITRSFRSGGNVTVLENALGNVGIGTYAPAAKLHVAGGIKVDGMSYGRFEGPGAATSLSADMNMPLATSPLNSGGLSLAGNFVTVANAGYYRIGAHLSFDLADTSRTLTYLYLSVNDNRTAGLRIGEIYTYYISNDSRLDTGYISGDTIVQLNAGDRVSAWVAVNGLPQLTIYYTRLTVQQLP